ncbi:MAG: hypothetical protein ACR2MQ_00265 [Gemmatimonadaceae bacterium]
MTTTDHAQIKKWVEARGGKPAAANGTGDKNDSGMIRINFPGNPHANDSKLQDISWDDWFRDFDANGLAFLYQDKAADGKTSNFNKLVNRDAGDNNG